MTQHIEILQLGNPVLRMKAAAVPDIKSPQTAEIIAQMLDILSHSKGVGLAAPQIGHSLSILVVASKPTARYPKASVMPPIVMINPTFHPLSEEQTKDWEGCLSIPGIRALVPRHNVVEIRYTDVDGRKTTLQLNGFPARIFQHEYDHLQGLVYLDRVENNRDIISESEFLKLMAA